MRNTVVAALLLAASFQSPCAFGQEIEPLPVQKALARLSQALAGETADRAALVTNGMTARMQQDRPADEWLDFLDSAAAASGGVEVVTTLSETERFAEYVVRSRSADRFARLVLGVARAEPDRISTLFILPARDPAAVAADAWPQTQIPEDDLSDEIRRRVDKLVAENLFSGAILVARGDAIVHEQYAGLANQATGVRNGPDTRFNAGSSGKMFTAVAAARLIEAGKLSLNDTVGRWIPDYPDEAGRAITVAQLLGHTAGLGDFFGSAYRAQARSFLVAADYLPLIAKPPMFPPGERFAYSNAGYALLGVIIERASGEDFFDHLAHAVFTPSGMSSVRFDTLDDAGADRAIGYFRPAKDAFGVAGRQPNLDAIAYRGNAAGGAYVSARDMLAFMRALVNHRLMKPETTELFTTSRNDMTGAPTPTRYGYGFIERRCGETVFFGHGGGGTESGVNTMALTSADGQWTIIVLANYDPPVADDLAQGLCGFLALQ